MKVHALKSDDVALVSIDLKKINQSKQPKYKKYMNEGCIIKKPNYVSLYNKLFYYLNWDNVDVHGVFQLLTSFLENRCQQFFFFWQCDTLFCQYYNMKIYKYIIFIKYYKMHIICTFMHVFSFSRSQILYINIYISKKTSVCTCK